MSHSSSLFDVGPRMSAPFDIYIMERRALSSLQGLDAVMQSCSPTLAVRTMSPRGDVLWMKGLMVHIPLLNVQ